MLRYGQFLKAKGLNLIAQFDEVYVRVSLLTYCSGSRMSNIKHSAKGSYSTSNSFKNVGKILVISFPIFSEQDYNAERIHRKEYGICFSKVSSMFTDRPQKPLETALWWTEFVIRHSKEDLAALRPLNVGQLWWKRRQLDVWTTVTVIASSAAFLSLLCYVMYRLLKCTFNIGTSSTTKTKLSESSTSRKKVQ